MRAEVDLARLLLREDDGSDESDGGGANGYARQPSSSFFSSSTTLGYKAIQLQRSMHSQDNVVDVAESTGSVGVGVVPSSPPVNAHVRRR